MRQKFRWINIVQSSLNANIFKKSYSKLSTELVKKSSSAPETFCSSNTKDYYANTFINKRHEFHLINVSEECKIAKLKPLFERG